MTPTEIHSFENLLKIVDQAKVINLPAIDALPMTMLDLGMDSLHLISLSVAFEDSCKLKIDIDNLTDQSTLAELLNNLKLL
jgi:acyl carrier protein